MNRNNPYSLSEEKPVSRIFSGRTMEISRIFSRIGAARPQSVSLIGEPGIGKSSLLEYLRTEKVMADYLEEPEDVVLMEKKISKDNDLEQSPVEFIDSLSAMIMDRTKTSSEDSGYEGFMDLIKKLDDTLFKLVFCFDDFHHITENTGYPMEFFSFLRSAANNYNVAYITTSPLELQKLCVSQVVEESPFFNIFTNIPLRPFKQKEALEFIIEPSAAAGLSLKDYSDKIIEWAGTVPMDLNFACEILFDSLAEADSGRISDKELKDFEEKYSATMAAEYKKRWEKFGPEFKDVFINLISAKKIHKSRKYLAIELERKGYLAGESKDFKVLSDGFVQYIGFVSGIEPVRTGRKNWFTRFFSKKS
ncbi:ATP-binding protein [Desulfobacterales bacterium HSG16]|nr:ATP-binding protein [Desulfobacterales bacterium HSG16]